MAYAAFKRDFNSRKDRLKVTSMCLLFPPIHEFQFQKGPIERIGATCWYIEKSRFQFQKGPIERESSGSIPFCMDWFQFQKGPIESWSSLHRTRHYWNFNSRKDRLKDRALVPSITRVQISIPERTDWKHYQLSVLCARKNLFQFQKGPIERPVEYQHKWSLRTFQFQKGPIESPE